MTETDDAALIPAFPQGPRKAPIPAFPQKGKERAVRCAQKL